MSLIEKIGVVIIGRNEGDRLKRCFESILQDTNNIVYVDSGSTDDSVALAKSLNIEVVNLDTSIPFSAGRARNEGFEHLTRNSPDTEFVQFADGDCEIEPDWLTQALTTLKDNKDVAIVCGRRAEKYPDASIYNMLCDIEWNTPVGQARACGGDFMVKSAAYEKVKGFNPTVVAGEEPELCFRLRSAGWKILRIDQPMTRHDANIHSVKQWWRRSVRSGHAYAQGWDLHGNSEEKYNAAQMRSILIWGTLMPALIIFGTLTGLYWLGSAALALLFVQFFRIVKKSSSAFKISSKVNMAYSLSLLAGKVPQSLGIVRYNINKLTRKKHKIIEYK